jgi:hypothetical protein
VAGIVPKAVSSRRQPLANKFKFADSGWSCGTNFGYKSPSDGVAVLGGEAVPVNPCSKYEDMKFSPDADGVYEFYLNMAGDTPTVYVKKP